MDCLPKDHCAQMIPGLAASFLLLFVEAVADLAKPPSTRGNYDVLAARAYHAISDNYDVPGGAAYATTLLVPGFAVYMVQRYWVSRRNVVAVTGKPSGRTHIVRDRASRIALLTPAVAIAALHRPDIRDDHRRWLRQDPRREQ